MIYYISKLEVVYPFANTKKIITWFQNNNPARQRFKYPLEPDNTNFFTDEFKSEDEPNLIEGFRHHAEFSGLNIEQIWAAIAVIIKKEIEDPARGQSGRLQERAFLYRHFTHIYEFEKIGQTLGVSRQTASKYCAEVEDRLTRCFCKRKLINPLKLQELLNFPDKHIN
jgi:hypothetical protein